MADQGVAVGVQAAGLHRDHHVAGAYATGAEQLARLHHSGGGAGDVVVVGVEQAGVLGGLAADERAAGDDAGLGDALDDGRDPLGDDAAAGDVVGHEERLGAAHDEVVDDHADEVEADRVVHVHQLRDRDLGADAVGRGGQQRPLVAGQRRGVEEPGEATEAADHLGAAGLLDPPLHQVDRAVGRLDRDPGRGVGPGSGRGGLVGHAGLLVAYDGGSGVVEDRECAAHRGRLQRGLEQVLAEQALVGELDGVLAGEAGGAEACRASAWSRRSSRRGRCSPACRPRRSRRSPRASARWRSARRGWRSRCRRSTATSPAGSRSARAPRAHPPRAASAPARAGCCRARSSRPPRRSACRGSCGRAR